MTNPQNSKREVVLAMLPATVAHIAWKTKLHRNTVGRWISRLNKHGPERCVHIESWERRPGAHAPIYARGNLPDVPCTLERLPQAERTQRWKRAAQKGGRWELILRKRRAVKSAARQTYLNDPLLAWIPRPAPTGESHV